MPINNGLYNFIQNIKIQRYKMTNFVFFLIFLSYFNPKKNRLNQGDKNDLQ